MFNYGAFLPHPPILIPAIGRGNAYQALDTMKGMVEVANRLKKERPNTILFISPHGNVFDNGICIMGGKELTGDFSAFGYKEGAYKKVNNEALAMELVMALEDAGHDAVLLTQDLSKGYGCDYSLDHGALVPIHYIDQVYSDYQIVHVTPGQLSVKEHYKMGMCIKKVLEQKAEKICVIASGDLSHCLKDESVYTYNTQGKVFDEKIVDSLKKGSVLDILTIDKGVLRNAQQCGYKSFVIALGMCEGQKIETHVYSYEGPFGVGYMTGDFYMHKEKLPSVLMAYEQHQSSQYKQKKETEDDYVRLAREAITYHLGSYRKLKIEEVVETYKEGFFEKLKSQRAGVFVSIYHEEQLRGCIGTLLPTSDHLFDEIVYNSMHAATADPRFTAIQSSELEEITIKVDIVKDIEIIHSKKELDVKQYGLIVEKNGKRGVLLPNLEGISSIEEQIKIAKEKAEISQSEAVTMYRFKVDRHGI